MASSSGSRTDLPRRPAYLEIADAIAQRIFSRTYRPGDRLPSESQFAAEFGVSPVTLRRALSVLTERGLLSAEQGRGTFVRSLDLSGAAFSLKHLADVWSDGSVEVRLLRAASMPADESVSAVLGCRLGERSLFLHRLLLRDGEPVMSHREHLIYDPRRPLVESELRITSLEGILQAANAQGFARGRLVARAVNLSDEDAALLHQPPGSATFCLEHVFKDFDGLTVSWGWFLCRADLFWLETDVGLDGAIEERRP